jgi:hypothetical protein
MSEQAPQTVYVQASQGTSGKAITIFVLSLVNLFMFPVLPAIIALAMAGGAEREIALTGQKGGDLLKAGKVISWIGLILQLGGIILVFFLVMGGLFLGAATH